MTAEWFVDQLNSFKTNTHFYGRCTVMGFAPYGTEHPVITARLMAFRAAWDKAPIATREEVRAVIA